MKTKKRYMAIVISLCLLASLVQGFTPVYAEEEIATGLASSSIALEEMGDVEVTGDMESADESAEPFVAPDIVDIEEVEANGYIGREKEQEKDMYSFVFRNNDGTNTMRVYSHPVKYVSGTGEIRDISLDLKTKSGGGFVTADHEIRTSFEEHLSEGISLEYGEVDITLVPKLISRTRTSPTATISTDKRKVRYDIDATTSLEYELTYAGFKEDIVVEQYTGQTEYTFILYTNGLTLCVENGSYYLADASGNIQATIGDVIIFTADERNNAMGTMTHETIHANEEYQLTIHVDADYLADEATKYPIRIDPTIEVNYESNGAGAIQDVTVSSQYGSSGTSGSLYIGRQSTEGISRVLMRFPNLDLSSIVAEDCVYQAAVEMRDLMCESTAMTVQCHVFTGNTWTDTTATWSTAAATNVGVQVSSQTVSYANGASKTTPHRYSFAITNAVKGWVSGTYNKNKGLIFKAPATVENGSTYTYKTFASYNRASYKPSLIIHYQESTIEGEYHMVFQEDGKMISGNTAGTLSKATYNASATALRWVFTELQNGVYVIRQASNLNKCLTANPSTGAITISTVQTGNPNQQWTKNFSDGMTLKSCSTSANIAGKKLYYTGSTFTLSNTTYTSLAFVEADWYVPCTGISMEDLVMVEGVTRYLYPTYSPSNANACSGTWSTYTSSDTDVFTITEAGVITTKNYGMATLTIKDKITGVTTTANVFVSRPPNPDAQNKTNWCWAASSKMVGVHNRGLNPSITPGAVVPNYKSDYHSYGNVDFTGRDEIGQVTVDAIQRSIVVTIMPQKDDGNHKGSALEIEAALEYVASNATSESVVTTTMSDAVITLLNNELATGRWVVACLVPPGTTDGHAIVIRSKNEVNSTYTYWDPWTDDEGTFGVTAMKSDRIVLESSSDEYELVSFQYCR